MERSVVRVLSLIKRDFILNARVFSLLAFTLCGVCMFIMFASTEEYCNTETYVDVTETIFVAILFSGCLIFSASIFIEFRDNSSRAQYLKLPATTFEKWFSKWLLALPIFTLLMSLLIFITYSIFAYYLESLWSECNFIPFLDPLTSMSVFTSQNWKAFLLLQSIMFLLGIMYNKYGVFKALVTIFLLNIPLTFYNLQDRNILIDYPAVDYSKLYLMTVPFVWLISYFMLKAKQI